MLSPYRVLDLTLGPEQLGGQILADLGADVVLVEPPGGVPSRRMAPYVDGIADPERSLTFWAYNRNKRSITVDLDTEDGREHLRGLVRRSHFLLESFPPGYLAERGLDYASLSAINPALVMVSLTPFGQTGPKANWAACDLTAWAAATALVLAGDSDRPPIAVSVPQAYLHAGGDIAVGALIAHAARERDGLGQHVDVSAQTSAMAGSSTLVLASGWGDRPSVRMSGGVNFGGIPLKLVHPAKDGFVSVTFLFGSSIGPFSRRLMEVMCERGFVDEATRDKDWIAYTSLIVSGQEPMSELLRCIDAISAFTASMTKQELFDLALERGLLIVPVATTADIAESPQLAIRDYWRDMEHADLGRTVRYPGPFAKPAAAPLQYRRRPPLVGEHAAELAAERREVLAAPRSTAGGGRALPLAGVKVADFMWVAAGPGATRYFADFGATVVKVESTRRIDALRTVGPFKDGTPGPEQSAWYSTINAGKLGLTLDLGHEKGREIAFRLTQWADVVTESFTPGTMQRMGLDYETIRRGNPGVIMLSSCLNGQYGPLSGLAGFGTMGMQLAGFGDLAGWPDRPPAGPAGAYTDYIAPKFTAAVLLAALDHRARTGEGQHIDFAQAEASVQFLGPAIMDCLVNGNIQTRRGNTSPDMAPHGVYPARGNDRWVAIAAMDDAQWAALCRVTGRADWLADPRFATAAGRVEHHAVLDEGLARWTADREVGDIEQTLQATGVAVHRAADTNDAFADPQLAHRGHLPYLEHPVHGRVPVEGPRLLLSATPAHLTHPGPTFAQHNEQVLRDVLGLNDDAIAELVVEGVLE